jgi:hypothetical protein
MSELASYSIQSVFFALVAVVVVSRSKKTDLYQFALTAIWLVGVIAVYARYRADQVLFYSNDQLFHQQVIEYYLPEEGFQISAVIGMRYLLTFPVYLISLLGFNAMLVIKFFQLCALLLIYKRSQWFMSEQLLMIRFWQLPIIAGPLLIFMSLLSLRDVLLAYFALLFVTSNMLKSKLLALSGSFLLRPHLAVALVVGVIAYQLLVKIRPKYGLFTISISSIASYVLGSFANSIGKVLQQGLIYENPSQVFSQLKFSQMAANFVGLQFLIIDDSRNLFVAASTTSLLLARFVFFDTILIPVLFLISVFRNSQYLNREKMVTLQAFMFFYGVVSQTTWNSTRQNIPFLACMGLIAVADMEHFRKIKAKLKPKLLTVTR